MNVKKNELATLFGVKPATVGKWVAEGMPRIGNSGPNVVYPLKEVIQWYVNKMSVQVAPQSVTDDTEELIKREKLLKLQIQNGLLSKDVISLGTANQMLDHYLSQIRDALTTLEFQWSTELVGIKTEAEATKVLAELRDRLMRGLQDLPQYEFPTLDVAIDDENDE